MLLVKLMELALLLFEAGHWVCWFWDPWEGLWCSSVSDTACDWPREADLELPVIHNLWLCWAWLYMGKTSCTPRSTLISTGPGGKSAKVSRQLDEICLLSQPASCLLGLITERAIGYMPQHGIALQGGVRGYLEGGIIAIPQADAL